METPTHSRRSSKTNGPIPVLGGDMTVEDWKKTLSKMTAGAAAETVVANYICDPICDYGPASRCCVACCKLGRSYIIAHTSTARD
jgi:hypothetical protein